MAHVVFIVDADRDRRARFEAGVRRLFAGLPQTTIGEARAGSASCLWAAGPRAPCDVRQEGDRLALLIGYAVDDDGRWSGAEEVTGRWLAEDGADRVHDGYHVGICHDPGRGWAAGVDPLGLFPLYHAPLPEGGALVTSTPQAFLCHPHFSWRLDRTGLTGILLAHGLLDDRPLLAGTRRLPLGCRLRALPGREAEERVVFRMDWHPAPPGETFAESCARLDAEVAAAIRRHRPPGDDGVLMLSGGLDSRLVAAHLASAGIPARAVSFGRPRDHEVLASRAVAARLGMPHEVVSTEEVDADFVDRSRRTVLFDHLSSAPGGDDFAEGLRMAAVEARYSWSGVAFDWVLEPISDCCGWDDAQSRWSFDLMLRHIETWGVPSCRLPALLGADGGALCADVIDRMRSFCMTGEMPPERRGMVLRWNQRVRSHIASALHRTSFVAWPLVVASDRRVLSAAFGLPRATVADRRLEQAMLVARHPGLAAIPLDANSFLFQPRTAESAIASAARRLAARMRRAVQPLWPGGDPRRYERLYNVDQPRWRAVRRAAETQRPRLHEHLDARALAAILPPPGASLRSRRPLFVGNPIRLLTGLALLLGRQ